MVFQYLLGIRQIRYLSLYSVQKHLQRDRPAFVMHILGCRTGICCFILSAEVSSMLHDPFPAPFLCNLIHLSLYFIQNSVNITFKQLIPFSASHIFLKMITGILGCLLNSSIIFLCRRPVFPHYLSLSCDYAYCKYCCSFGTDN